MMFRPAEKALLALTARHWFLVTMASDKYSFSKIFPWTPNKLGPSI